MTIEELLEKPYWLIDILPERVPADSAGQYFAVEKYFLGKKQLAAVKDRHIGLILRLNCYMELLFGEEGERNPDPAKIARAMRSETVWLRTGDALIMSEPDDLCMTLYNPDEALLQLVRTLAASEGLYVWKGTES